MASIDRIVRMRDADIKADNAEAEVAEALFALRNDRFPTGAGRIAAEDRLEEATRAYHAALREVARAYGTHKVQ